MGKQDGGFWILVCATPGFPSSSPRAVFESVVNKFVDVPNMIDAVFTCFINFFDLKSNKKKFGLNF